MLKELNDISVSDDESSVGEAALWQETVEETKTNQPEREAMTTAEEYVVPEWDKWNHGSLRMADNEETRSKEDDKDKHNQGKTRRHRSWPSPFRP